MKLNFKRYTQVQSARSKEAVRNIALSFGAKGVSVIATLLLVPMTINYVNPTQYGIWLTLSQIIGWVSFFDLGLGNGFRNKYAEAKANGDMQLAREYLSTTYFAITTIVSIVFILIFVGNYFLDWSEILKVDSSYKDELQKVFAVLACFFCLNMIANIFSTLLTADQKPGLAATLYSIGQLASLGAIYLLTQIATGSLYNLALYFSGVPCIVLLISTIYAFYFTRYKNIRPRLSDIHLRYIKDIVSLGVKFFIIYLCLIAIFQVMNVVLARELGASAVTEYNIAYKYFNVLYSLLLIVITPFWSAFTDAYTKKDFEWMKTTLIKLEKLWFNSIAIGIVMLIFSQYVYKVWIGNSVSVSFTLSACLLIFVLVQGLSNIYMYLINGIGFIRIQLSTYLLFALLAWPMLTYSCRLFGACGIVFFPTLTYLAQAILSKIQVTKILNNRARGWWIK